MNRILSACLLLCLASLGFGVVATTTLTYTYGGAQIVNIPTNFATNATENVVIVTVTPGHPVTVEFNDTAAWYYRTTTGVATNDKPIPAATPEKLRFTITTTFYTVRQTADGTMSAMALLVE
jgi:hypothetical protein